MKSQNGVGNRELRLSTRKHSGNGLGKAMAQWLCWGWLMLMATAGVAHAKAPVWIIYEQNANLNDNGFNASAHQGVLESQRQFDMGYEEHVVPLNTDYITFYQSLFKKHVPRAVLGIGFEHLHAIEAMARVYPQVQFTLIDAVSDQQLANVLSVPFRDQEGAFLMGIAAALTSKAGKVGFIGGMESDIIRNMAYGYRQGAEYANPNIVVESAMIGNDFRAWNNPSLASDIAKGQIAQGVDVVFAAAGGSSLGALKAAADAGIMGIGVDNNQNSYQPGYILTSMVKKVNLAVYGTMASLHDGSWHPGVKELGVAEHGIDYAVDQHNLALLSPASRQQLENAKQLIRQGIIQVRTAPVIQDAKQAKVTP